MNGSRIADFIGEKIFFRRFRLRFFGGARRKKKRDENGKKDSFLPKELIHEVKIRRLKGMKRQKKAPEEIRGLLRVTLKLIYQEFF